MPKDYTVKRRQRLLVVVSILILLFPLLLSGKPNNVAGAAYSTISDISYDNYYDQRTTLITLSDGTQLTRDNWSMSSTSSTKVRTFYNSYGSTKVGKVYISGGILYTQVEGSSAVAVLSDVKDFYVMTNSQYDLSKFSYFALKTDGTLWSWGVGTGGQLAVGASANKTVPSEVLDPSGVELSGVSKIFWFSYQSALVVKGSKVYLLGAAFGQTSLTTPSSKLIDITTKFPAFTADNFNVSFVNGQNNDRMTTRLYQSGSSEIKTDVATRIFNINGADYTLRDFFAYRTPTDTYDETTAASPVFIPVPASINLATLHRYFKPVIQPITKGDYLWTGYTSIKNGDLLYWGMNSYSTTLDTIKTMASGVDAVTGGSHTYWYLSGGKVYTFGENSYARSGIAGGSISTPVRVSGPSNEIVGIKEIAADDSRTYALNSRNEIISWSNATDYNIFPKKYLSVFTTTGLGGSNVVYGITTAGILEALGSTTGSPVTGAPMMYPNHYVAPVVLDLPISSTTVDKFNRHVVTVDYGSSADIQTREYSLDGGGTWSNYTSPVVLTQSGTISFKARSGANATYSPIMSLVVINDPIVITAGYPKVMDRGDGSFSVETGTTYPGVKVEVRADSGAWETYVGPVILPIGSHTIDVRVLNSNDEELGTGTADVAGPVPTATPTATSTATATPTATPTATAAPTATPTATAAPTATPTATVAPTATPAPTVDPGWGSPIGAQDVTFTVLSGGFSSQFNGLMLDNVTISTSNPYQVINSVTQSVIEDSRGTGVGWNYTLKVTDFISNPVADNSLGTVDLVVKMPTTALSVDVTNSTTLAGQDSNMSLNGNYVFSNEPVVLAKANEFQGMGQYQIPMSYMLRVPDKVEVVSAGSGSAYQAGAKTGLRVGTYRSQFTFTLASGI